VNVCWDCIKGRHGICAGADDDGPCRCPVPHTPGAQCARKPIWVCEGMGFYADPGADACAAGDAETWDDGCHVHEPAQCSRCGVPHVCVSPSSRFPVPLGFDGGHCTRCRDAHECRER
jgi:hypothetical protein